ncbi:aldose epimerase family protein [Olsenella sp. HMSC062G07]|uniref:aldose epimerase family protein n=1 Tax=Olsenella sp. HMSC062G07 TaxID=1739330 RepID=UPI0008A3131B|nr:aldose epimerase family protein [Olsenella sp. HMSC062G07]OFK23879.1 galactose mutarotase [Olsenella sp. HMSC062G07]
MSAHARSFGSARDGQGVRLLTLENEGGMRVSVTTLGAILQEVSVPNGNGGVTDVTLGYDDAHGYLSHGGSLGAVIGRNANRIAGASFELGGTTHRLAKTHGAHNLHSGPHVWRERAWDVVSEPATLPDGSSSVCLGLTSRDGDQGFPGSARVTATYALRLDNRLELTLRAEVSRTTIVNLTSHAYWNLNGHAAGSALGHRLSLDACAYTPTDDELIPTGRVEPVEGTIYDLREPTVLSTRLIDLPQGYDTNFCLDNGERFERAATLVGDETGITMELFTDAPGLQLYTGGGLDARGKGGARYGAFGGIALEPQFYPDAPHHRNFPQPVYAPGHPYLLRIAWAFGLA